MATINQLPSGSWRAQIRRKGLATLGETFKTRAEAAAWATAKEAELLVAYHQASPRIAKTGTLANIVEKYFQSTVYRNKAPTTQSRERSCSVRVIECLGHYAITTIDSLVIQEYLDARGGEYVRHANGKPTNKLVSANTIRLEKAFLSSVFKWAKGRKYITVNIMADSFDLPRCYPREGRISESQQLRLYEEAMALMNTPGTNPCLAAWTYFVFNTGTRPGEAAKIEVSWVDLDKKRIHIPRRGSKKRNPRTILLTDNLAKTIHEQVAKAQEAGSKYLFFSRANERRKTRPDGTPVRRLRTEEEKVTRECIPYQYYHAWRNLCRHAEISEKINPHIMRHEFICRLFEKTNLSDSQIAMLVGDVNVLSLEPYKHVLVERLRDHYDAHQDSISSTLEELLTKKQEDLAKLSEYLTGVLTEAQEERERNGDFSTPIDWLHAAFLAEEEEKRRAKERSSEEKS
ncbi:site-specific recombinase XerD [Paucimonas lemoignei]|uniref:Site-specific recombinase XerD n=1 Tax=Paucimonas lemoignei TaxID=29443 RepID=A0A4R3HU29_PAULE|nr:tyrosine-type recombinase/integrase [Paucimonas lemoignei]TCS32927.1 site-specific recombinase XerD [Paucimonas lemoignei]